MKRTSIIIILFVIILSSCVSDTGGESESKLSDASVLCNMYNYNIFAQKGEEFYFYIADNEVFRYDIKAETANCISDNVQSYFVTSDRIFYNNFEDGKFYSMDYYGDNVQLIGDFYCNELAEGADLIYLSVNHHEKVYQIHLEENEKEVLLEFSAYNLWPVNDEIFFLRQGTPGIWKYNLEGNLETVINDDVKRFVIAENRVYFINKKYNIECYELNSENREEVITNTYVFPTSVNIYDNKLIFSTLTGQAVFLLDIDTNKQEVIRQGTYDVIYILNNQIIAFNLAKDKMDSWVQ